MTRSELSVRIKAAWSVLEQPAATDVLGNPPYHYIFQDLLDQMGDKRFDELDCEGLSGVSYPLEELREFKYLWYYLGGLMLCTLSHWGRDEGSTAPGYVVGKLFDAVHEMTRSIDARRLATSEQLCASHDFLVLMRDDFGEDMSLLSVSMESIARELLCIADVIKAERGK